MDLDDATALVDTEMDHEKNDVAIITPQSLEEETEKEVVHYADNYEDMKKIVFQPLNPELEILDETVYTWEIKGWRQLSQKTHSEAFECGGFPWKILFFPFGNNTEFASIYLEHGFDPAPPENWYCCVQFGLVLWNPNEPSNHTFLHAHHRFTKEDGDWGFTRFRELRKLFTKQEGHERPLVEDECANLSAYVRIVKDPTGVLWHNFHNYDSKKETGYVGLRNQGATCYLNSLLQSLYFTNSFRRAVFQIPTEGEDVSNSALALQRLFYQLQNAKDAVDTAELTRSFGWEAKHIFEQRDVQELCRKLMEALEEKMKGTKAENSLAKLFVGKMRTYIDCINVKYTSSRVEDFWDIQLNVRGFKNLDASFRDYIAVETLEGENKYFAEGHGLQEAKKGVIFESFPEVLHLHLKRFEYDFMRDEMMKVNDHYEFPLEFDASPYLVPEADRSEPWIYTLHGVLVHSGDFNAGHYYGFLKPEKDGFFFRFDDERVVRATMHEVLNDNFGGDYGSLTHPRPEYTRLTPLKRSMSAYMLVYIRKSRIDEVLPTLVPEDTPAHLEARLEKERQEKEARRKELEEQHLYLRVKIISESQFQAHQGFDIAVWDEQSPHQDAKPLSIKIKKQGTVGDLTKQIADSIGADPLDVRLWVMVNRQNRTIRPDNPLTDMEMTVEEAASKHANKNTDFRLWVENQKNLVRGTTVDVRSPGPHAILLFLKYFDAETQSLKGAGSIYMRKQDKVSEILAPLQKYTGIKQTIQLYEEIKPNMIEPMKLKQTFQQAEIQNGDILCFQKELPIALAQEIRAKGAYADAKEFYEYLFYKITVAFVPRNKEDELERFEMDFNRKINYDQLAARVGGHLGVDPTHLRFTTVSPTGVARAPVKRSELTLAQILASANMTSTVLTQSTLMYEVLDLSLSELETKKNQRLVWLPEGISKEEQLEFLVPKQGQLQDLLPLMKEKLKLEDADIQSIRFFEASGGKFQKLLSPDHAVAGIPEFMRLYAERVPEDELQVDESLTTVSAFHFHKEPAKVHRDGVPFQFVIKDGETFKDTRERLQKRTGIKGKLFEKIKFAVVSKVAFSKPRYLEDEDVLSEILQPGDNLGLDHVDKSSRGLWGRGGDQAIFIR